MKNILIVTGGSGGHVVPATSFFGHLKNKFSLNIVSDLRGSKFLGSSKFKYEIVDVPNLFSKHYLLPLKSDTIFTENLFFKCSNKEVDGTTWPPEPPVTISIFFILI